MSKPKAELSIGKKYGKLLVLELSDERATDGRKKVKCLCDCGQETVKIFSKLSQGKTTSCGCAIIENAKKQVVIMHNLMFNSGKWTKDPKIGAIKHLFANAYADGNLTIEEFSYLTQQNCFYCGIEPSNKYYLYRHREGYTEFRKENGYYIYNGLDRIDNTRPHDSDNVVPCCADCNRARLARTQQNFIEWIEKTYLHLQSKNLIVVVVQPF